MPACVWVCTTHIRSGRAMWIAEWMVKPAAFTRRLCVSPSSTDVAVQVDLHQVGGAHLVEQHAELVDQEMVLRPRQPRAEMRVDEVGPAMMRDQPVQRGQVAADLPFLSDTPASEAGSVATFMSISSVDLARALQRVAQLRRA